MSVRNWLWNLLGGNSNPTTDPDEFVEIEAIPPHLGPLAHTVLERGGIKSRQTETFNAATGALAIRVSVPRRDTEAAILVLAELRQG